MGEQRGSTPDGLGNAPDGLDDACPRVRAGRPMLAVGPAETLGAAVSRMREHRVRQLPVVSGGRCVALLTERDVVRALASATDVDAAIARPVESVCRGPAPTVEAGAPLPVMASALLAGGAEAAVVVSRGTVVGIVTTSDVIGAVRTPRVDHADALGLADLDWAIPRPR